MNETTDALAIYRASAKPLPDTQASHELVAAALAQVGHEAAAIVPPACPSWCELPAGHRYSAEDLPDEGFRRDHVSSVSAVVSVEAVEERNAAGGVTLHEAKIMLVDVDVMLEPAQAYDLSDDLNTAAKRCESIRAEARR